MPASGWRLAAPLLLVLLALPATAQLPADPAIPGDAAVFLQGPGLKGDATLEGVEGWIALESCSVSIQASGPGLIDRRLDVTLRNDRGLAHLLNAAVSDPAFQQLRLAWVDSQGPGVAKVATALLDTARLTDVQLALDTQGMNLAAGFAFVSSTWTAPVDLPVGDDTSALLGSSFDLLLDTALIKGESILSGHAGWTELRSVVLAIDCSGPFPQVSGPAGNLRLDSTWPQWVGVVVAGEVLREATVEVIQAQAGEPTTLFRLTLERMTLDAAYASSNPGVDHESSLQFSIPEKLSWEYIPLDPMTGAPGIPIKGCYDLVRNEPCSS